MHKVAAVDIEGVVRQVHEDMAQVLLAWFLQKESIKDLNEGLFDDMGTASKSRGEHSRDYLIGLSAKSRQAFLGDVDLQRLQRLYQHVKADIELELVDEQWLIDVLLDHRLLGLRTRHEFQLTGVPNEVDAVALRAPVWLHDEGGIQSGILLFHHADLQRRKEKVRL